MTLSLAPLRPPYTEWVNIERERRRLFAFLPMLADDDLAREQAERAVPIEPGSGTEVLTVERDGRDVGWVWLRRTTGLEVLDADVDAPAEELLDLLSASTGGGPLLLERLAGAATAEALVALPGWSPTASHMALTVTSAPAETRVRLAKVSAATWDAYLADTIRGYADEIASSMSMTAEEATAKAVADTERLLPEGPDSAGQFIFDVWDDDEAVALVWIGQQSPKAGFVYDVVVREGSRGLGLGRATMNAAAAWCREQGYAVLGLNVFGANTLARRLYESLGYRVVDEQLRYDPSSVPLMDVES